MISLFVIIPMDFNIPTAIAKSKIAPSFLKFAGDKFITYFLLAISIPQFLIAVFTLSLDSLILVGEKVLLVQLVMKKIEKSFIKKFI